MLGNWLFVMQNEQNISYIEYVLMIFLLSLQTKADSFYNKESFLQEIFQNVLRTGSNLMANQTLPAWRDLSRSRRIKGQLISKDILFLLISSKSMNIFAKKLP